MFVYTKYNSNISHDHIAPPSSHQPTPGVLLTLRLPAGVLGPRLCVHRLAGARCDGPRSLNLRLDLLPRRLRIALSARVTQTARQHYGAL